ncbi:PP2C family protein-serine/threonine phosphatase [Alkalibacter mobilis]|uniref:PP2C family protein-serine/threonine phosphatase n=1 Tax=Alkalibacter mobilis TaxID=2787712 RepID=UPI00189E29F4|nr:MASE3 domain-containing protein [Alkalibacter mobilis]MBF7096764.1 SpoIIE family protein phosphatase [Alkalibacter mobilis]
MISEKLGKYDDYKTIFGSLVISAIVFYFVRYLENHVYKIFLTDHYLVFHTIVEYASIVMYFATFLLIYYVGDRDGRLRMKITASTLLFVGFIDFWHTFSYEGMPGILVDSSVQSATAFWILGRFVFALGLLVGSFIPLRKRVGTKYRLLFLWIPIISAVFFLIYISLFPEKFPVLFVEGQGLTLTKQILEYTIILIMMLAFVLLMKEFKRQKRKSLSLFLSALIVSIFSELAFASYANVYDTYNLLGHIYKLIASYMIFKVMFIFNVHYPYVELDKAKGQLNKYANNLEFLVKQRTREVQEANEQLFKDLDYAKKIQKAIMPKQNEEFEAIEFFSEYIPCEKVGGDFFGIEDLSDRYIAFYIGDVAGHGIPAAMMTIFMKQAITTRRVYQSGVKDIYSPREVLTNLYMEYNETDFPFEMYAVMIYGLIDKNTKEMIFSSAGLNTYPILKRHNGNAKRLVHNGFPICKYNKDFKPDFTDYKYDLKSGDKIIFYTDGTIEAKNNEGDFFGEEKIVNLMKKSDDKSPKSISKELLDKLHGFTDSEKIKDDINFFIIGIK